MEQHQHTFLGWLNHHWAFISLVCFPAFMCYLNAISIFFKVMGATQLADFLAKLEDALTASVNAVKTYKQQATKIGVILLFLPLLTGCASAGLNGFCGRVTAQEVTVPYIGGKTNIDGFMCHLGGVGMKVAQPDYSVLESVMNHYADSQTTQGKIMTNSPGVITFTPSK